MKIIQKILSLIVVISIVAMGGSFFMKKRLPDSDHLLHELSKPPIQNKTSDESFLFDYNETPYEIDPQAEYELWGLVVTHNDINKWYDIYHDETSVDLKDICVVWGSNAIGGVYEKMKFKSGSWTCYWSTRDELTWQSFKHNEISNNHLLSSDVNIQEKMKHLKIGDQVHLKGYLANYTNKTNNWTRETSMSREDTGGTSCEVVYVNELEILKSYNAYWYLIYFLGKWLILLGIALKIGLVVLEISFNFENKRKKI